MPVLALGGEKSYGTQMKAELETWRRNVKGGVVPNPATGSWRKIRAATTKLVVDFLK